jgi:hypothetical protein
MRVDFLADAVIETEAYRLLRDAGQQGVIPVNIESIIERHLGVEIVPIPDLKSSFGIDGFTSGDWSQIAIDEYTYLYADRRGRSTLGHEVGHRLLHRRQLEQEARSFGIDGVDDWIRFYRSMDDGARFRYEQQGYIFSGMLLVPTEQLVEAFDAELPAVNELANEARSHEIARSKYLDNSIDYAAGKIAPKFLVSTEVVHRRIVNSGLADRIA